MAVVARLSLATKSREGLVAVAAAGAVVELLALAGVEEVSMDRPAEVIAQCLSVLEPGRGGEVE